MRVSEGASSFMSTNDVLLVTGSRDTTGLTAAHVAQVLDALVPPPSKLITGGAQGVDLMAMNWALAHNIPYQSYPPDYATLKKYAPLARNTTLVADATRVLAIWDGKSRGTLDAITKARAAGKPLVIQRFGKEGLVVTS
jgi:hypothetical protein